MPRGYRRLLITALGWLSLTGQGQPAGDGPKSDRNLEQGQRPAGTQEAANTIAAAIRDTIHPIEQDQGCDKGKDQRQSDLCAQWKAADASQDAANYAFWALFISAIGTGLLVWTLAETRSISRRELRAYVSVRSGGIVIHHNDAKGTLISFEVVSHNGGSTPAYHCVHLATLAIMTRQQAAAELRSIKPIDKSAYSGGTVIHSGDDFISEMPNRILVSPDLVDAIKAGAYSLYMFGVSSYVDTFGIRRRTDFCQFIDGDRFAEIYDKGIAAPGEPIVTKWGIAHFHNEAT